MRSVFIFLCFAFMLGTITLTEADLPAQDALVLFLTFDDLDGQMVEDSGPNGFDVRMEGTYRWENEGKIGGAMEFEAGRALTPSVGEDMLDVEQLTVAAWIFPTIISEETTCHNWGNMIYQKSGSSDDSVEFVLLGGDGICLYLNTGPGGNKRMGPFDGADVDNSVTVLDAGIQEDQWYHAAATFDGENMRLYLNAEMIGEKNIGKNNPSIVWNDNESSVGGRSHNESWFVGLIDEFALYNRALTEGELQQLMSGKMPVEKRNNLATTWGGIRARR
jgi:hypothetical protein